jgi:hypothetical protein
MVVRDAIERALRLLGALGGGDAPTADEMSDALLAFNNLKASWFGTLIGGRISEQIVAAGSPNIQAENGGEYPVPGGLAYTVFAPANPVSGARFGVVDAGLAFGTTACTVNPNGRLINGAGANLALSTNGVGGRWWYRGDAGGWIQEADWTDPSDAMEWPEAVAAWFPYMLALALAAEFNTEVRADVIAADTLGRAVMARTYGPRGRNLMDQPLGSPWPQPPGPSPGGVASA